MSMKKLLAVWEKKKLQYRLESAIVDELDEQSRRLYALEENRKQKDAAILQLQKDLATLRASVAGKVTI